MQINKLHNENQIIIDQLPPPLLPPFCGVSAHNSTSCCFLQRNPAYHLIHSHISSFTEGHFQL